MPTDLRLGSKVKVIQIIDHHIFIGNESEEFEKTFLHRIGRIVAFDNTECGATPKDPMIRVKFWNGKVDAFWTEELEGR